MTKEDYVKNLISDSGHSVKSFASSIDLPYTTLLGMLNRGLDGASVLNVIKVCKALSITVEDLEHINDNNVDNPKKVLLSYEEQKHISNMNKLNDIGKEKVYTYTKDLVASKNYGI